MPDNINYVPDQFLLKSGFWKILLQAWDPNEPKITGSLFFSLPTSAETKAGRRLERVTDNAEMVQTLLLQTVDLWHCFEAKG